jgi:hypothetical protein
LAEGTRRLGRLDLAAALHPATRCEGYALTSEPDAYRDLGENTVVPIKCVYGQAEAARRRIEAAVTADEPATRGSTPITATRMRREESVAAGLDRSD